MLGAAVVDVEDVMTLDAGIEVALAVELGIDSEWEDDCLADKEWPALVLVAAITSTPTKLAKKLSCYRGRRER